MKLRTTLIAVASTAALATPALVLAPAGHAEPNPCAGQVDHGTASWVGPHGTPQYLSGTWWNCSGGTGADTVRIDVARGFDSKCITVRYGTTGSIYQRGSGNPIRGWKRC